MEELKNLLLMQGYKKVMNEEAVQDYTIPNADDFNIPKSYSVCM